MNTQNRRLPFVVISILLAITVGLVGLTVYRNSTFRLASSSPKLSNVPTAAPYVELVFSQDIDAKQLSIQAPQTVMSEPTVKGKTVTLNFTGSLVADTEYVLVLRKVVSTSGKTIENKEIHLVARNLPISSLSKAQRAHLVAQQDQHIYSFYSIDYSNFDKLTDQGLTAAHVELVKQAVFNYSQIRKEEFTSLSFDADSVAIGPYDRNSAKPVSSVIFTILANQTPYTARVTYSDINTANVQILTTTDGQIVYDSAKALSY